MSPVSDKTVLITGSNSGIGFEAAAQLAEAGWGNVILACRTEEKAETARKLLVERTGKDPFKVLAIDTSEVDSANAASDQLLEDDIHIDFLLLNAGSTGSTPMFNSDGGRDHLGVEPCRPSCSGDAPSWQRFAHAECSYRHRGF